MRSWSWLPACLVLAAVVACGKGGPEVVSIYPQDGASGVPLDAVVEIAFDRPVELASRQAPITLKLDGEAVEGMVTLGTEGGPLRFEPRYFLLAGRTYQVLPGPGVEDRSGRAWKPPAPLQFNTVEGCSIEPADQARLAAGPDGSGGTIIPGGRRIEPLGVQLEADSFPSNLALAPGGALLVAINDGWGIENKVQSLTVIDPAVPRVIQTIERPRPEALFWGLHFTGDGHRLYVAGGGSDRIEVFDVQPDNTLEKSGELGVEGFPAGLELDEAHGVIYVAAQLDADVAALELGTGTQRWRSQVGSLPYDVELGPEGRKLYVSLWGRTELYQPGRVGVLNAGTGEVLEFIEVGKNPEDLLLGPDGRLFVACADDDRIDVIDTYSDALLASWKLREDDDPVGLSPTALALDPARGRLYVTCSQENALQVRALDDGRLLGKIPTAWYPTAVVPSAGGDTLFIANGRGTGTGPNLEFVDIESLLTGTVSVVPTPGDDALPALSAAVRDNNTHALRFYPARCLGKAFPVPRTLGGPSPIKHVVFVLRENKTYDQNLGDLEGTDGDPSLVMFGEEVTPNLHALAREFCNLDNFHAEVEVSVTGHYWAVASTLNDFAEKAWHASYRDDSRFPALGARQVGYPAGLFIWHKLQEAGIPFRNYGEPYGLAGEYDHFADSINMEYMLDLGQNLYSRPDAERVQWILDEVEAGVFPSFVYVTLPNDHTYGRRPGQPTPRWMVAENDYATGLLVDGISHSPYWPETLIIVTEDDPQSGADHVDNHRSIALLISPYTRRGYTSSVHYGFSSLIRTYGLILGMPALNLLDRTASPVYDCFTSRPDFTPFEVRDQRVPYEENPEGVPGAAESKRMDFSAPDRARGLGQVLWMATHPGEPVPAQLLHEKEEHEEEPRRVLPVPEASFPPTEERP